MPETHALISAAVGLGQGLGGIVGAAYVASLLGLLFFCVVRRIVGER